MSFRFLIIMLVLVVLLVLGPITVTGYAPRPAGFWWLNDYLDGKTFGRFEPSPLPQAFVGTGPCPTYGTKCSLDFATLPNSVKNIGVALPDPFNFAVTLGGVLPQGLLSIWETELSSFEIGSVVIAGTSISPTRHSFIITLSNVKFSFATEMQFSGIQIPSFVGISPIFVTARAAKASQTTGTTLKFQTFIDSPPGYTLQNSLPGNATLTNCSAVLDLALSVIVSTSYPFQDVTNTIISFVLGIAQPLLGYALCEFVVPQVFKTVLDRPGAINTFLSFLRESVANISTRATPNVALQEAVLAATLTAPQLTTATNFNTLLRLGTKVVNNWLGVPLNNPTINAAITSLTTARGGVPGRFVLQNLDQWGVALSLPLPPFTLNLSTSNLTLDSINTFKSFTLLNASDVHSTKTRLALSSLSVRLQGQVKLIDNMFPVGWVLHRPPVPSVQPVAAFNYDVGFTVTDLDFQLFLTLFMDLSLLGGLQFGQLLGKNTGKVIAFEQAIQAIKCIAPAVFAASIPSLSLNMSDISGVSFVMSPQDVGIVNVANSAALKGKDILKSALLKQIVPILQHVARPLINDLIEYILTLDASTSCPVYVSATTEYPNFESSTIFNALSTIIRDAVGGTSVSPSSSVSINKIIDVLAQVAIDVLKLTSVIHPAAGEFYAYPDVRLYAGRSLPSKTVSNFAFQSFMINGLDSFTTLLLEKVVGSPNALNLTLVIGSMANPLELGFVIRTYAILGSTTMDETINVKLSLQGLLLSIAPDLDFELNRFYSLTLSNVRNPWCLLAPFASFGLKAFRLSVGSVAVTVLATSGGTSTPGNYLRAAATSLAGETFPSRLTMLNYIFSSITTYSMSKLSPAIENTLVDESTCASKQNPTEGFLFNILYELATGNFTELFIQEFSTRAPDALTPVAADGVAALPFGAEPEDLSTNFVIALLQGFLTEIKRTGLARSFQTLGNSTNSFFKTQSDLSVSFMFNVSDYLPALDLGIFMNGATLTIETLNVSRISSVNSTSLQLLKPVSRFVTKTFIAVPDTVHVGFSVLMQFPKSVKTPGATGTFSDRLTFDFDLKDFVLDLELLTALDTRKIAMLQLSNLFIYNNVTAAYTIDIRNVLTCLFDVFFVDGLSINRLEVFSSAATVPSFLIKSSTGALFSQGLLNMVNALWKLFIDFYARDARDITQGPVRKFINKYLLLPAVNYPGTCVVSSIPLTASGSTGAVQLINSVTNTLLPGRDRSYSLMNAALNAAFSAITFFPMVNGTATLGFSDFALAFKGKPLGTLGLSLSNIRLGGIGTVTGLNIFDDNSANRRRLYESRELVAATYLSNSISLTGPSYIELDFRFSAGNGLFVTNVEDEVRIRLSGDNIQLALDVVLAANSAELLNLPFSSFLNPLQLVCIVSRTLQNFSVQAFDLNFTRVDLEVSCIGPCTSPLLQQIIVNNLIQPVRLLRFTSFAQVVLGLGVDQLISSALFKEVLTYTLNNVGTGTCASASDSAGVSLALLRTIFNAPAPPNFNASVIYGLVIAASLSAIALLTPFAIIRHYQLKDRVLALDLKFAKLETDNGDQATVARYLQWREMSRSGLNRHPAIPRILKIAIPIIALANIAFLLLSAFYFVAFSMEAILTLMGDPTNTVLIKEFTIPSLINALWNAGIWWLSLGLVVLSCVLPVGKNIAMLILFFSPEWTVSREFRNGTIVFLNFIGRFSFIESFIIVVVQGAASFNLKLSEAPSVTFAALLPEKLFILRTFIRPDLAFFFLALSAMSTLVLLQLVEYYIDKSDFENRVFLKPLDTQMVGRNELIYHSRYHFIGYPVLGHYKYFVRIGLTFALFGTMCMLIIAFVAPFFTMTYNGAIGIALGLLLENGRARTFSLITMGNYFQTDNGVSSNFITFAFFLLFYFAIIFAPLASLACHLILFLHPFSFFMARKMHFVARMLGAWSAVEVFWLAVLFCSFELTPILTYILDDVTHGACSAVDPALVDVLGQIDGHCLNSSFVLEWGFFFTFFAMSAQIGLCVIMTQVNGIILKDREAVLRKEIAKNVDFGWTWYLILKPLVVGDIPRPAPVDWRSYVKFKLPSLNAFNCFKGIDSKDLRLPNEQDGDSGTQKNNKWNVPQEFKGHDPHHPPPYQANPIFSLESKASTTGGGNKYNVPPPAAQSGGGPKYNVPNQALPPGYAAPIANKYVAQPQPAPAGGERWSARLLRAATKGPAKPSAPSAPTAPPPLHKPSAAARFSTNLLQSAARKTVEPTSQQVAVVAPSADSGNPKFKRDPTFSV